uniref:Zinc finger protein PLAG1 n=2 Tax=Cacopsylla melanoneura TaxID=428564 RepID=A0A8D8WW82_9HEMI
MGSKSPADLGSHHGDNESLSSSSTVLELCTICQRPTDQPNKDTPLCTCNTPKQSSQPENISFKKKKDFKKPTSGLSKRQLFPEESPGTARQIEPGQDEIKEEDPSIPTSPHTCPVCGEQFFSSDILSQHLEVHPATSSGLSTSLTPKPPPTPPPAPSLTPTPSTSTASTGKSPTERPFACDNCSKAFSSKFKLMRHVLIHSDQRQYRCTTCDKTFHRKDHLKNHIKVHNPVKRRYKCEKEDCGKEYSSILSFKKHNAVHSVEEGSLDCKICGNLFSSKEDIVTHLKIHSGSRTMKTPADRKYHCEHCDRSFFTGKDVRRHMVVHTGRRDFLCQFCPQRFGRKDHLTRHIKKSHNNSSKKNKLKKSSSSGLSSNEGKDKTVKPPPVDSYVSYEQDVECNIDPLSADVKEVCETITSGFYKEPKTEDTTGEENVMYVTVPYEETTPGPSSVFQDSHFQPFPPDHIKLEESDFTADNNDGLTSLIELMPIMSGSEIDATPTPDFLESGSESRTFIGFNTNEFLNLYMEPNETQTLPRFNQAFNVTQHPTPDQEHSTDELHLSDPNPNSN